LALDSAADAHDSLPGIVKPLKKGATYADRCAVPEDFVAEILGGELYASPQPVVRQVRAASAIGPMPLI
jgi:hypothetical protein